MEVQVGDLIHKAKVCRCGDGDYPVLSMTMHDGLMFQNDRFKKQIASVDLSNYQVVKRHQLVESFPIDEGVLAVQELTEEGIVSPAYKIWDVNMDRVIPLYLELALRAPRSIEYYKSKLRGTTARRRSITDAEFCAMQISLPDLKEQERIIELISRTRAISVKRQQELDTLDDLIKARFVELFGNILTDKDLPLVQLSELADIGSSKRIYANEYVEEGIPFYRSKEIRELGSGLKPSVELFIKPERYEEIKEKYGIPKVGDILIAAIGATIGYSWIVNTESPFYYKDGNLIILSIKAVVNPIFLNHTMGILIEDFKNKGVAGSAQLALTIEKLEKLMVVNPDIGLQNIFADFVKQVDKSKVVVQKALNEAQTLFNSLMQEYFG